MSKQTVFEEEEDPSSKSFFSEIIASVSDLKFSRDGRYILSRDYLTLKVWDINMDNKPVQTINIHDHLKSKFCDLYENDCIFDKFECCFSGDGSHVLTGSYSNYFHIFDRNNKDDVILQADKSAFKSKKLSGGVNGTSKTSKTLGGKKLGILGGGGGGNAGGNSKREDFLNSDSLDFGKKILHASWHPRENTVALAATNNLFLFQQTL